MATADGPRTVALLRAGLDRVARGWAALLERPLVWLAPTLVLLGLFQLYPMVEALRLSLTDATLLRPGADYVGLANYVDLLTDPEFWAMLRVTAVHAFSSVVLHVLLGVAIVPVLWLHLRDRLHAPTAALEGADRRDALRYAGLVGAGAVAWRSQRTVNRLLGTDSAGRRFTGSRERGSDDGNRFPVTMWVADDPEPVDPGTWSLSVGGAVTDPFTLDHDDLSADGRRRAVIDCTSGWYSEHEWAGVPVADLLERAGPTGDARWVQFRSVTGYRWSLPVEEARGALLATAVDDERLSHGHGFPLRLVAPGRRGFQWVKWVESVRVTRRRELGEWVAIFASGLSE